MSTLEDRAREFLADQGLLSLDVRPAIVQDLVDFVVAEIGFSSTPELRGSWPLVLYFKNPEDRQELVEAIHEAKPGMIERKWP